MLMDARKDLPQSCVSDLQLDRWHAEELTAAESRAMEAHLQECARCQRRDQELRVQAEAFLRRYPSPAGLVPKSRTARPDRSKPRRLSRWTVAWMSGALAVAAAAGWIIMVSKRDDSTGGIRLKGGARLEFFVKRDGRVVRGHDGFLVHPGDQLRFSVTTAARKQVAILSRDGQGQVSECYPGDGHSRELAASRDQLLDSSVELDDTLGNERFIAVFCDEPFALAPLVAKLGQDGTLAPPANCTLDTLELRKTAR